MKAFLIDPGIRQVTEVTLKLKDNSYIEAISNLLGCEWVEQIFTFDTGDQLYVDDKGLKNSNYLAFFIKDCPPPIFGKGIVIGIDKNEKTIPPILTQQAIKDAVSFLDKAQTEVIREERINEPSFRVVATKKR